ncbi:MAG: WD40 repeat domain-containing protein, partial [Myxococcota bacterium]
MSFPDLPDPAKLAFLDWLNTKEGAQLRATHRNAIPVNVELPLWHRGPAGFSECTGPIRKLAVSPDIDSLVVLSDNQAKVLDLHTGQVRHVVGTNDQPARAVAPDGSAILTCPETGGNALLYSPEGQLLRTPLVSSIPHPPHAFALSAMQFKRNRESLGNWVLMAFCGHETSYFCSPHQHLRPLRSDTRPLQGTALSADEPLISMIAPSPEHAVAVIMLRSGEAWLLTQSHGSGRNTSFCLEDVPTASTISPSGEFFAVGTQTGRLTLFPVEAAPPEAYQEGPPQALADAQAHAGAITSIAISSCDRFIVTGSEDGSEDGTARLWSLDVREEAAREWIPWRWVRGRASVPVLRYRGCIRLPSPVTAVAFCERGEFVAIGRSDGKLNLIHLGKEFRSTSGRNP